MKKTGLKKLILVPTSVGMFLLIAVFLYGVWKFQKYELGRDYSDELESCDRLFKVHTDTDIRTLSLALDALGQDKKLQSLFQRRDRAALNAYAQPLFKNLHDKFQITHFYFHDLNRVCFLRVHQPDRFGDVIGRTTLLQAEKTGKQGAGIELGPLGTLALRVVQPIEIDGRVEGYLELGEEITHFTHEIAEVLDVRLAVLIDKSFLDREGYVGGTGIHEKSSNWNDLPNDVALEFQPSGIAPQMLSSIIAMENNPSRKTEEIRVDKKPYLTGEISLRDISDRKVGRIIVFQGIAEQMAAARHLMLILGIASYLASILVLCVIYVYLRHVDRIVTRSHLVVLDAVRQREADQASHVEELLPFRKAFEGAPDAIAIIDLDRRLLFVNPAFEQLTGYTKEMLNELGGTAKLYYDSQSGSRAFLKVSQGRTFNGEMKIQDKHGNSIDVYLRASPIAKDDGEMIGILGIFTDLRERKSAEQELLRQAKALVETNRAIVEARNAGHAACNKDRPLG